MVAVVLLLCTRESAAARYIKCLLRDLLWLVAVHLQHVDITPHGHSKLCETTCNQTSKWPASVQHFIILSDQRVGNSKYEKVSLKCQFPQIYEEIRPSGAKPARQEFQTY